MLSTGVRTGPEGAKGSGSLEEFDFEAGKLQTGQSLTWETKGYFSFLRLRNKEGQEVPLWYLACPGCKKKVQFNRCENCQKDVHESQGQLRYVLSSMIFEDDQTVRWMSAFDDAGKDLLGMSADRLQTVLR